MAKDIANHIYPAILGLTPYAATKYYMPMPITSFKSGLKPQTIIASAVGFPILFGAFLLMLPLASRNGQWTDPLTALFMSTSAMCVTGHCVVDVGAYFTLFGQGVILVLVQIGGLGFMTMAMSLLIIAGRRLSLRNETALSLSMGMRDRREIKRFLLQTIVLSLALELLAAVILALRLLTQRDLTLVQAFYQGLFHSVCAFCNAGFSLYSDNLIGLRRDSVFLFTIMILIVVGGIGFLVLSELYFRIYDARKKHAVLSLHSRMVMTSTIALIVAAWMGFMALEWSGVLAPLSLYDKSVCSLFQAVTPRTAGFNVIDMAAVAPATKFMTMALMFIGGSPGSTAGGIKTTTVIVLVFAVVAMIRNRRDSVVLGRTISPGVTGEALSVFLVSLLVVAGMFGLLLVTEQGGLSAGKVTFDNLLFDTVSAFGTVGLSTGVIPLLTAAGKMIIIICMFIGRVGPLTMAIFIGMREHRGLLRYPEEDVIIG